MRIKKVILICLFLLPWIAQGMRNSNPWESLQSDNNWKYVEYYGWFQDVKYPWVFHENQGWQWLQPDDSGSSLWYFDPTMGWLYRNEKTGDRFWSFNRHSWLRYESGDHMHRSFWDYTLEEMIEYNRAPVLNPGLNGFKYDHSIISTAEILPGGPNRDGIPPIFAPEFVKPEVYDAYRLAEQDDFSDETDEVVISVTIDGITRAYPIRILNWHEVVNDEINGYPFMVTYCPLCGTGMTFSRLVNGRQLTFAVSGLLWADNVLFWDHETESLWSQILTRAVTGPQFGNKLTWIPSRQMRWSVWKRDYPDGLVLDLTQVNVEAPYRINPYKFVNETDEPLFNPRNVRDDLLLKAWVLGILIDGEARAYPRDIIRWTDPIVEWVNGVEVEVSYNHASRSATGRRLDTGEEIPVVQSFWFAWASIHPDTTVFEP